MTYHDTLHAISDAAERKVMAAYRAWQAGALTDAQFEQLVAGLVARANVNATALAEYALAMNVTVQTGAVPASRGVAPVSADTTRLRKGVATLVADLKAGTDITDRLTRFATAEPEEAAQQAFQQGIADTPAARGWRRRLSASACQLCKWWWRDGRVWPADHYFQTHKGCTCTPEPVLATNIRQTEYTTTGRRYDNRHRDDWNAGNTNRKPEL